MPRVLLLLPTTSYRTEAFVGAATRLGVEVTVASEQACSHLSSMIRKKRRSGSSLSVESTGAV